MAVEVKICGIADPADAEMAGEAGASYLGVVLSTGPRRVDEARAAEIVAAAGTVPVYGVFGSRSAVEIAEVCRRTGLRGAQLHGRYATADGTRLRAVGLAVWRVARLGGGDLADLEGLAEAADAVLIEPAVAGVEGGAGVALDYRLASAARRALSGARLVLAGGLLPETVLAAIRAVGPDVVDVSSGVERSPGKKDPGRVKRFLEAVRDAGH